MLVIDQVPDPTLSPRTHERGNTLILILTQRPEHVKVALDPIRVGALRHHADPSAGKPRENDLRRALAVICGDCQDLRRRTVSILGVLHARGAAEESVTYLGIFERPGALTVGDRWS